MKNSLFIGLIAILLTSQVMGLTLEERVQHQYSHLADDLATHYQGAVTISIQKDTPKVVHFWVSVFKETTGCTSKLCLKGWVDKYSEVQEKQQVHLGYTNPDLKIKPFFSFSANSDTDFKILTPPNLDGAFAQIIYIACQKLNALDRKSLINKYQVLKPTVAHKLTHSQINKFAKFQISNSKISAIQVAKFQKSVPINGFTISKSLANDVIVLDKSQLVGSRKQNYNFNFVTDKKKTFEDTELASFAGGINVDLNIIGTSTQTALLGQINGKLAGLGTTSLINNQQSLVAFRKTINQKLLPTDIDSDIEPKITAIKFDNQKLINVNIADIRQKTNIIKINNLKNKGIHKLAMNQMKQVTIEQSIEIDLSNIQHSSAAPKNLINQKKIIYSKTILGKRVEVSVGIVCDLLLTSPQHQVRCTSKFYYTLFGNNKQFTIFTFTKPINYQWSWSSGWSGSWSFSFSIPLPPPVSFITINFHFAIRYSMGASIKVAPVNQNPFKYVASLTAYTQVDAQARASLRVIVIEGGVFLRGTIVKLSTDPTLALTYVNTKLITVSFNWYFTINAFVLEWGFFYRYWTFWSGWSGVKVIASWKINGITAKYPIITKSWNINL